MEVDYIKEFVVLVEKKNFLEAADSLFISQSTLSRHIKSIEQDLGATLFDRSTRKAELNKYGRLFLPYAKEIVRIQYEYTTAFYNHLKGISGTVSLGTIPVIAQYHISDAMARFQQENNKFSLNVIEADSSILIHMLLENKCDFAFIREEEAQISNETLTKIPFATDNMAAILPVNHPLARDTSIQLKQLSQESFLMLPPGTMMNSLCISECEKVGFTPNIAFTSYRGANLIDMASKNSGVALLMKKTATFIANTQVAIVDIEPAITTTISLAYKKNCTMTMAAKHFLDCVKSL